MYYISLEQKWQGWPRLDPERYLFQLRYPIGMIAKKYGKGKQALLNKISKLADYCDFSRASIFKACMKEAAVAAVFMFEFNLF